MGPPAAETHAPIDDFSASLRRERAAAMLLPLFFFSGATGLAYQVIWARHLHLVFGTSTFAISTVLAAFMGGLALGGWAMGRIADRISAPLAAYGVLELGIGVYALVFPWLVGGVEPVYLASWRWLHPGPVAFGAIQAVLAGATLLVPTALMGATLPLLARFATERLGAVGDRVGTLYGINTAGAVVGTWLCGFLLLPQLGMSTTTLIAAACNLGLGAAALWLSRWSRGAERARVKDDLGEADFAPAWGAVAVVMALAGGASLVYEVAWTRLLGLMLGGSTYAFSLMLLAFLVGIASGGKLGGVLADRVLGGWGRSGVLWLLAAIEVGVAVLSYLLMHAYQELPFWYVWLFDALGAEHDATWMWLVSLVLSGAIMTPPAVLMGVAFPVAVRAVVGRVDALGGPVGKVYAANSAGAMVGAAVAGFVLLPLFAVRGTVLLAVGVNLLAAGWLVLRAVREQGRQPWALVAGSGIGAVALLVGMIAWRPPWEPLLMTAGMYKYVTAFSDHSRAGILNYAVEQYDLLYYREGLSSVVTVARNRDSGNIWLANNGKVEASTTVDMPTQVLVSLLPFQFVDRPRDAMVIGLASGISAGAITLLDEVERIDVVELEPAIEEAARFYDPYNHQVLDDPRVSLIANDGRNQLLLTAPASYDVIVSEPSNPWISGVANLFTREFFELGRSRLRPGGVWSQWVQLYGMDTSDLRSLLATFSAVFPHVLVYATVEDADLVLVGSDAPLQPSPEQAGRLIDTSGPVRTELEAIGITDPLDLVAIFQMDRDRVLDWAADIPLNTDDNLRIEYRAPLSLHRDTQLDNYRAVFENAMVPLEAIGDRPDVLAALARRYHARDDSIRAISAMAGAAYMSEDLVVREQRLDEAEAYQDELREEFKELDQDN